MNKLTIFLIFLLPLTGCGTIIEKYDEVEFSAGIEIPNPILPVDVSVKLKLKDYDSEKKANVENDIYNHLVGSGLLDEWMRDHQQSGSSGGEHEASNGSSGETNPASGSEN